MSLKFNTDYQENVEYWLNQFKAIVDESRLRRGERLYKHGSIIKYAKKNNGFTAIIQGSRNHRYNIDADFSYDENGLPDLDDFYMECSCPDWVEFCKHSICAVFFFTGELNHELLNKEAVSSSEISKLEKDFLTRRVMMSEHNLFTLPNAGFWNEKPDLPDALRKLHKQITRKMKNHRYTP